MRITLDSGQISCGADLSKGTDISIAVRKNGNVNCYFLSDPEFVYFDSPQFSGSLAKGGSVNCERISLYPHASGTHTECALHVLPVNFDMRSVTIPALQLCHLISVQPELIDGNREINRSVLAGLQNDEKFEAIIVRTLPNGDDKTHKNYSDTNPPYFEPETLIFLREMGFKHLITDLPSIDKESDEGRLAAHKNWFSEGDLVPSDRTVTELVYVPSEVADGIYVLSMQVPAIETDAVPSRIVIYPCE